MNYAELDSPLYHGSDTSFTVIDLSKSAPKKDFGSGFYTTNDSIQAEKFALMKAKRTHSSQGYVEVFHLQNYEGLHIKKFDNSDEEWFDFILCNRGYDSLSTVNVDIFFDIVIGPVANDAVGLVLNQFIAGVYGEPGTSEAKETAIRLLLAQKLHNQVFFGTEKAVERMRFSEVYDVTFK